MTPAGPPIRDAATVVILRRDPDGGHRVLMGMRGAGAAFMPSKFVFPGGAVDPGDETDAPVVSGLAAEPREGGCPPAALTGCALRELREETGFTLRPDTVLRFFFRAITPPGRPRRFDARFFLIDAEAIAGDPDDFTQACDELSHLRWVSLAEARSLDLPFITEVVLAEVTALAADPSARTGAVPFFDNRSAEPRFCTIAC